MPSSPPPQSPSSSSQPPSRRPFFLRSLSFTTSEDDYDDSVSDNAPLLPQHSQDGKWAGDGKEVHRIKARGAGRGGEPAHAGTLRRSRRAKRLLSLAQGTTLFIFVGIVLCASSLAGWVFTILYQRHNAYAQAVFASPMVPNPVAVEGRVTAFPLWMSVNETQRSEGTEEEERVAAIQEELDTRFSSLDLPPSLALPCASLSPSSSSPDLFARYAPLVSANRTGPTFLALNLYNSARVLPSLSRTLLTLASFLGPQSVHISIFENGSTDDTTVALAHLAAALSAAGVPHTITSDARRTDWAKVDRIAQLALYRNVALEPLTSSSSSSPSSPSSSNTSSSSSSSSDLSTTEDILFINDVFVCPADALELLFQRRVQRADAACGMDWREDKKWWFSQGSVKFYDNWVSRSLTGNLLRHKFDVLSEMRDGVKEVFDRPGDEYSRARFEKGVAVPVYSCWNGMLALTAEPFLSSETSSRYEDEETDSWARTKPLELQGEPATFRSALGSVGECSASECKTVARDLWTRGYDRWMIIPTVRTTYDLSSYLHPQLVSLSALLRPSASSLSLSSSTTLSSPLSPTDERIDWSALSPPTSVVCFEWARGWHIDLEWWRATLELPYAGAVAVSRRWSR